MTTDLEDRKETKAKRKRPKRYTVVILNDDFTPMEFVVAILQRVFALSAVDAEAVMMAIHKKGKGNVGLFTHEVAETKAAQIVTAARSNEFPLQAAPEAV